MHPSARPLRLALLRACLLATALAFATGSSGCFTQRVATPAELQQLGTRKYSGKSRDEVIEATITALRLKGYEVVTTEPRIRTSPKPVAVSAYGGGSSAQTFTEAVAWDIEVEGQADSATVHASVRASVNGEPMEQVFYSWAERNFAELMKEIDAAFATKTALTALPRAQRG